MAIIPIPVMIPINSISGAIGEVPGFITFLGWLIIGVTLWMVGLVFSICTAEQLWCKYTQKDRSLAPGLIAIMLWFLLTGIVFVLIGGINK